MNEIVRRHFIITYGPTGSGKGTVRRLYEEYLRTHHPNDTPAIFHPHKFLSNTLSHSRVLSPGSSDNRVFRAEIDEYVENDEEYKTKSMEIIKSFITDHCKKEEDLKSCFSTKGPILLTHKLGELYLRVRTLIASDLLHVRSDQPAKRRTKHWTRTSSEPFKRVRMLCTKPLECTVRSIGSGMLSATTNIPTCVTL